MSSGYLVILVLYAFGSFGALLAIAECMAWLFRRPLVRFISRLRPSDGIIAHGILRLLPFAFATLLTCLCAVPSYFHEEPLGTAERPGISLVLLAAVGVYAILRPTLDVLALLLRTARKTKIWSEHITRQNDFVGLPVLELEMDRTLVVAAGVRRKRIYLSENIRELLSPGELQAVLRHEVAHCRHHHNLLKIVYLVVPRIMPIPSFEEGLHEVMEYVADDEACAQPGDELNLASAVIALARTSTLLPRSIASGLVEGQRSALLQRRLQRMVKGRASTSGSLTRVAFASASLLSAVLVLAAQPTAQNAFRETLEWLVR